MIDIYGTGGPHLPMKWLVALASSDIRLLVYGMQPVYGFVRFLHLASMASFFGVVVLVEVTRAGFFPSSSLAQAREPMLALMNWCFGIALATGLGLFLYDPLGVGLHTMFLPKVVLVLLGFGHAHWVQRLSYVKNKKHMKRAAAIAAIMIWLLVIGASTWNRVERPMNPADIHRMDPEAQ